VFPHCRKIVQWRWVACQQIRNEIGGMNVNDSSMEVLREATVINCKVGYEIKGDRR